MVQKKESVCVCVCVCNSEEEEGAEDEGAEYIFEMEKGCIKSVKENVENVFLRRILDGMPSQALNPHQEAIS